MRPAVWPAKQKTEAAREFRKDVLRSKSNGMNGVSFERSRRISSNTEIAAPPSEIAAPIGVATHSTAATASANALPYSVRLIISKGVDGPATAGSARAAKRTAMPTGRFTT